MSRYVCSRCGREDDTDWTDYWIRLAMDLPILCAACDPKQRCHWHHEAERVAQKDEATETISP